MQQFRYIFLTVAMVALTGCQTNQQVEDRLVEAFGETMFGGGSEGHGEGELFSKSGYIAKWKSPVTVAIVEGASAKNTDLTKKSLAELALLSGLTFKWIQPGAGRINLDIHFSSKREFVINGNQRAACYARTGNAPNGRIFSVGIYISRTGKDEWRTDCLTHELLHALGWRGHTHRVRSAISYAHGETELTKWDKLMMRTLYDPRLPPGMSKNDAMPIARAILREMIQE
jgi:hypothetical protein